LGVLIDRVHRDLTEPEIQRIAQTYHNWRWIGKEEYVDIPGFCKSASFEEIKAHGYVLTPGRYVGAEEVEDDDEPFTETMSRLTAKLDQQFAESGKLEAIIRENLRGLGYTSI
jgi:type I restriction enzyme M protein